MPTPTFDTASVKVMRSHDYCHFEVCLTSSTARTPEAVDELRKTAARLADKAVDQYKVAKESMALTEGYQNRIHWDKSAIDQIRAMPETERTPENQARLKSYEDLCHRNQMRRRYDYEDHWEEPRYDDEE